MFGFHRASAPLTAHRAYQVALVAEVRMLIDYLAALPDRRLSEVEARECPPSPAPAPPGVPAPPAGPAPEDRPLKACHMLARVDAFDRALAADPAATLADEQSSTLQLIRDALVAKASPATGLTVAYTAMVVGNLRGAASTSRAGLAQAAYPGLHGGAVRQRFWHYCLIAFACFMTALAAWQATKVTLGKSIMHRLETLRIEQRALDGERARVEQEAAADNGKAANALAGFVDDASARTRVLSFALCDRPAAAAWEVRRAGTLDAVAVNMPLTPSAHQALGAERLKLYATGAQRQVCEHDHVLAINIGIVHKTLEDYESDWPEMAGAFYRDTSWSIGWLCRRLWGRAACQRQGWTLDRDQKDVEFLVAPQLIVWGNYVLPVIFGLLGALIYVILDLYSRTRASLLEPRDVLLSVTRLVLGLVTGACVGLFYSTYGPTGPEQGANLVDALTLSASGLAFLAGFSVEAVFTLLQIAIGRVFAVSGTK